ncbi:HAD-IA family hydrolase [uncultured Roseobacter sp.]|uniref:HAD-IA family hydrolase n=1 Tax=uncultured Roseobacter sp. TaxID=114847 RepID=UPI002634C996|nr:HAD-IA family hydrolase [uncultured Roseobacter sp.]
MADQLKLVIFDVDGTLVDSQADIVGAMTRAFGACGRDVPEHSVILGIVGLSLDTAMERLAPGASPAERVLMVEAYKDAYVGMRAKVGAAQSSPLYPGALDALDHLHADPEILLGVATGKSRRGLDKLVEAHGLEKYFVTRQVADFHPSKPHPSMILQAMQDAGVGPRETIMVGDTSFDMEMARAADVGALGVSWGYHPVSRLRAAHRVLDDFSLLPAAVSEMWRISG